MTLGGETQSRTASLVGADAAKDLALLQLDDVRDLRPAVLGTSRSVAVGDDVVAIGNALGLRGGPTVTRGAAALTAAVRAYEPGDAVTLSVTRDGDDREVRVVLAPLPLH